MNFPLFWMLVINVFPLLNFDLSWLENHYSKQLQMSFSAYYMTVGLLFYVLHIRMCNLIIPSQSHNFCLQKMDFNVHPLQLPYSVMVTCQPKIQCQIPSDFPATLQKIYLLSKWFTISEKCWSDRPPNSSRQPHNRKSMISSNTATPQLPSILTCL